MLTRRTICAALAGGLAAPVVSRASAQTTPEIHRAVEKLSQLHAILVRRGDKLLVSELRHGGLDRVTNIKSCSKSLVALLLGAAVARGEIPGVGAKLGELAPGLVPEEAAKGAADISMLDLVTLRAGLAPTSGANYGTWVASKNWVSYALSQPMIAAPGGPMIYSTGSTHVLGAVLAEVSGRSLRTLARERLGEPLGLEIPSWTRDPQGFYLGGNDMALTPRGMLRVALMMRDGGRYEGEQVLPPDWIRESLIARTHSPYSGLGYGYGWFLSDSGWIIARGYGGQIIAAHPEKDLAVAVASDPGRPATSGGYFGALMDLLEGPVLALG